MIGEPIDKPWPFARRVWLVLQIAGVVCLGASTLLWQEAPNSASRLIDLGLRIAAMVFLIAAWVVWRRWRKTEPD